MIWKWNLKWNWIALILLAALLIRLLCLWELRKETYIGNMRVSDALSYHEMAVSLLEKQYDHSKPFWQAPFYPYFLSVFYALFGRALSTLQWLHILIGLLNCTMLYLLCRRLFGTTVACLSAGMAAMYAPLILFDLQPLAVNLSIFFLLLTILFLLDFCSTGRYPALVVAAVTMGCGIISHGLMLLLIPVIAWWLYRISPGLPADRKRTSRSIVVIYFVWVLAAPVIVTVRNCVFSHEFVLISTNSGINFFIGNHPEFRKYYNIRNGIEWRLLRVRPLSEGYVSDSDQNRFFFKKAMDQFLMQPVAVAGTFLQKGVIAFSGSETSRNFPIHALRENSVVLKYLLWEFRIGKYTLLAFPTGLLFPFALLGLFWVIQEKEPNHIKKMEKMLPGIVALAYVGAMLLFFPCTRYRLPAMVLLMPYAGFAFAAIARKATAGRSHRFFSIPSILLCTLWIFMNTIGPLFAPRIPRMETSEHLFFQGRWYVRNGISGQDRQRFEKGMEYYRKSIEVDPTNLRSYDSLGYLCLDHFADSRKAVEYFRKGLRLLPADSAMVPVYREFIHKLEKKNRADNPNS